MARPAAPPEPVRCPRCGAAFGCGIDALRCWCASVTLTAERRAQLAAVYEGCLCPACLNEVEQAA
ncbi:MAG: hypothetical protein QOJ35_3895 [Solirubrobacteraceae bacterium]|nr:hypothetical protein [Solirubrobacteraceae bacterium]